MSEQPTPPIAEIDNRFGLVTSLISAGLFGLAALTLQHTNVEVFVPSGREITVGLNTFMALYFLFKAGYHFGKLR